MMAANTDDIERATRIAGFADAMAAAAPALVNAAKASLGNLGTNYKINGCMTKLTPLLDDPLLHTEVHKASIKAHFTLKL